MSASETAKLTRKFRIAIPKSLGAERGWRPGREVAIVPKGTGVLLVPVPDAGELAGIAAGANTTGYRDRGDRV